MATCSASTLATDASSNGFTQIAANETLFRAVYLQLLYSASGTTATETSLLADACTNGLLQVAEDEVMFRACALQLLCNATGG